MDDFWQSLATAIAATGTDDHVDRLIDMVGTVVPQDLITVTRYSATHKPEFVKHRRFSDEMVGRYLDTYYVFDPFYAYWRSERRLGVIPLRSLADDEAKRGRYIAEFLAQSEICDEVGILLEDGGDRCLGIFLDRSSRPFRESEIQRLEEAFAVFEALHRRHIEGAGSVHDRAAAGARDTMPAIDLANRPGLWPELTAREYELVELVLKGHPTSTIASRMQIAAGTVKNHRARIYEKLDITSERELFLLFFQRQSAAQP